MQNAAIHAEREHDVVGRIHSMAEWYRGGITSRGWQVGALEMQVPVQTVRQVTVPGSAVMTEHTNVPLQEALEDRKPAERRAPEHRATPR